MRTHERVLAWIEAELDAGRLTLGGRLPGERVLAENLGVSRPSVREAVRVLEALGVVRSATGSGPTAGAVLVADAAAGIGVALRLHVASRSVPVRDVVTLRVLVESWGVREAAAAPDADLLARAAELLDRMDVPGIGAEEFLRLDGEFHAVLAESAGNGLVTAVMSGVRGAVLAYVRAGAAGLGDWASMAERLRGEHREIFAAVRDGRPDEAERAVRSHIEGFYRDSGVT
ncbi:FadR/GntR family transcriptional regulator [Lentzea sp. NPDC058450]|uniref:FadR/GntR family transcriptional regulator n=1 Tax=Lentzea sp. NPDC058450 TaxID=3346505 RepID=UPI003663BA99